MGRLDDIYILPLEVGQFTKFYSAYKKEMNLDNLSQLLPAQSLFDDPKEYYGILNENKFK